MLEKSDRRMRPDARASSPCGPRAAPPGSEAPAICRLSACVVHRVETLGILRMAGAHLVPQTFRMGDVGCFIASPQVRNYVVTGRRQLHPSSRRSHRPVKCRISSAFLAAKVYAKGYEWAHPRGIPEGAYPKRIDSMANLPAEMTVTRDCRGGGPEQLKSARRPMPKPGEGEVLVPGAAAASIGRMSCSGRAAIRARGRLGSSGARDRRGSRRARPGASEGRVGDNGDGRCSPERLCGICGGGGRCACRSQR